MNQEQLDAALATMRWTRRALGQMTGYSDRQMRRWQTVPAPIEAWLRRMVRLLGQNPPPTPTHGRKPGTKEDTTCT